MLEGYEHVTAQCHNCKLGNYLYTPHLGPVSAPMLEETDILTVVALI